MGWKAKARLNLLSERSNHKVSQGIKWTQAITSVIVCSVDQSLPLVEMHCVQYTERSRAAVMLVQKCTEKQETTLYVVSCATQKTLNLKFELYLVLKDSQAKTIYCLLFFVYVPLSHTK